MALLKMVLRKMAKNKWYVLFLMLGLLISSALFSSIPMYTQGVLQKVLVKDLEDYQVKNSKYPGSFLVTYDTNSNDLATIIGQSDIKNNSMFTNERVMNYFNKNLSEFKKLNDYNKTQTSDILKLPILEKLFNYSTDTRIMTDENSKPTFSKDLVYARVQSSSDIQKHIVLTDGRMPSKNQVNGVYEALVTDQALNKLNIVLNKVYTMKDPTKNGFEPVKVMAVGSFNVKEGNDLYWGYFTPSIFSESFIIDQNLMLKDFVMKKPTQLTNAKWYYAYDYHSIGINTLFNIVNASNQIDNDLHQLSKNVDVSAPSISIIKEYYQKQQQLKTMLWSLNVPVIVILCLYLFMVSGLIIDREKNEIALLTSRGAGKFQVVFGYLIEGLILGVIAIVFGPYLGLLLCKFLGASSGFMEFVSRKALVVSIGASSLEYVLLAVGIFLVTLLVPAYMANKVNIVDYKRKIGRRSEKPLWQKYFFDLVLIMISIYGYWSFTQRQNVMKTSSIAASGLEIDPLLFLVPVLFILGISLLFLRIYPWIIKGIYSAGKSVWTPSLYGSLIQVGRSSVSYQFMMVFLMLTLSIGIFSATSARTINQNGLDKISYANGADIIVQPIWQIINSSNSSVPSGTSEAAGTTDNSSKPIQYIEPAYTPYTHLDGVENAAKVFQKTGVSALVDSKNFSNINLMAVDTYDFGNVTWFDKNLLPHHINEYLNILAASPSACLISKSVAKSTGLKVGDTYVLGWNSNDKVSFTVYGIVDYWPTFNPYIPNPGDKDTPNMLVVTNLSYIQDNFPKEPYSVWLKLKENTSSKVIYDSIAKNKLSISDLTDTKQELVNFKNSPFQLAINGSLTMGFIICGIICFLGFVLYWVISLKARQLQFGVLRAIGLPLLQLKIMMVWEQILTSGVAMIAGVLIGHYSSKFFVPFFQMSVDISSQVPPFKVITYASDQIKVYAFIGITVILGLGVLIYLLSKIKISNVIKLGED